VYSTSVSFVRPLLLSHHREDIKELPTKHLQSINLPSLLPLKLKLKVDVPVILLQNLCPKKGLCNRSCIVITSLQNYCSKGCLLREDFNRQLRTIPQIKLSLGEKDLTFTLTCKQFLVCLCFVITINKSQEQSFKQVRVDLRTPVFSHGQFYVIVSQVSSAADLYVLLPSDFDKTTNIVWPEILQDLAYRLSRYLKVIYRQGTVSNGPLS
jgi:hypothetical protein